MAGKSAQTVGFRYYMSLHMGIGRGPLNEIADIWVGGLSVLGGTDSICIAEEGQLVYLNKPDLFGGDDKEGGIQGPMFVYNGARDQELQPARTIPVPAPSGAGSGLSGVMLPYGGTVTLPSIADSLGGDVPSFRGVTTLWYDGLICAMNPYPKEWSFRVRRTSAGWFNNECWYPEKATITLLDEGGKVIRAMNGAHMIYEINTNPEWGRGMPPEMLDENSFIYAANTLCAEGLGLCMSWFRQETIKEFLPKVIDHIAGVQYLDRETGKLCLRLIRDDYDPDTLPIFGPDSGLLRVEDDDSSGEETAYNEIIVKGKNPVTKEDIVVGTHNLASIQSLGETISNTIEYPGFPTRALCARAAQRDLRFQTNLRKMTCYFDRRAWRLSPGMPIKISWPSKGIESMIVRVGDVTDASLSDGTIQVKVLQDAFGMPETSYVNPQPPIWTRPNFEPAPVADEHLIEVDYRSFFKLTGGQVTIPESAGYIGMLARPPVGVATSGYALATKAAAEDYVARATGGYTAVVTLVGDIGPLDTSATVLINSEFLGEYFGPSVMQIGDEQVGVTVTDPDTGAVTLERGVSDTLPAAHLDGAKLWMLDDEIVSDNREYVDGETAYAKALVRTSTSILPLDDATEVSVVMQQRVLRPFPPGNLKVNGQSVYALSGDHLEPEFTLAHRDRILQQDFIIGHTEGSTGPEAGVEYEIKIFAPDGVTLLRTETFATDNWTYDNTMIAADGGHGRVVVEVRSVRDTLYSLFFYRFDLVIDGGWGLDWDHNWG